MPGPVHRVVVSNGFNKFHLAAAAAELARAGELAALFTGVYPSRAVASILHPHMGRLPAGVDRMVARREAVEDQLVRAITLPELVYLSAMQLRRSGLKPLGDVSFALDRVSFRLYGRAAARRLRRMPSPDVYHYRAGFGHGSVAVARANGGTTICDQSLAHPFVLPSLLKTGTVLSTPTAVGAMGRMIADDIDRADHVLVNSHFVRETMIAAGRDPESVHVIYWGVDDSMMRSIQQVESRPRAHDLQLVFAGHAEHRKGFQTLVDALPRIHAPWHLTIAGPVSQEYEPVVTRLASDPRVTIAGNLSRHNLASLLVTSDALVFPTLAEGSARVVFEALAAGCYVITTPNAGSVVVDGEGGRLVPPLNADAVAAAVNELWDERGRLDAIAAYNSSMIREQYSQANYGRDLRATYRRLRASA